MGKILIFDLTSGDCSVERLDMETAKGFIGGLGINAWLMKRHYSAGTHPLSPDNPIILGAGPLAATGTPGAAKTVATTRFPLNGTISESVGSMRFARCLKGAGFDHVVILGKARRPCILSIRDGCATLEDAQDLAGADIFRATDALKRRDGGDRSSVIAIGPAGEKMVAFSLAMVDKASTLGRGGLAAVMGAKNLKAIAARGGASPVLYDPGRFARLLDGIRERLKRFKNHKRVLELGIMENWDNYVRQLSAWKGFTSLYPRDKAQEFYGPDVYRSLSRKRLGCPSCFTPDKDILEIKEGPYKGFKTTTTSYFNSFSIGHVFDLNTAEDKTAAVRMTDLVDRLGLDMFTFTSLMDFLISERENGNLATDAFAIPLERNITSLVSWANALSEGSAKAEMLAGGWRSLLSFLGDPFRVRAPVIKDCDILWDPRLAGLGTMEFEQIVSLKGPRSASGGSPTYIPGQGEESLPLFKTHLDRMGADTKAVDRIMDSPMGFNVGRMTRYSEDWYTLLSSLGICNRHFNNRFYSFALCRELFNAATGLGLEPDDLRAATARVWDLLKELNRMEGFGPSHDIPPEIWFKPMSGSNGQMLGIRDYFGKQELTREDISRLVADYYEERGWKDAQAHEAAG